MKRIIIYISSLSLMLSACDTLPEPEMKVAKTFPVSGEWYVHEYYSDGSNYGPYHVQVYNTSFSQDSVWISNIYGDGVVIKSIVTPDKTFNITDAPDYSEGYQKATISNSQIISSDSIYFDVVLYNTDGDVEAEFSTAGQRWTGLEEE
jgi:hypothetical protein